MSTGWDFVSDRSLGTVEVVSAVRAQPLKPTAMSELGGRSVLRSPEQLRLHRALEGIGWVGVIDEFNDAARRKNPSVPEPILIATNGTILAGFGRWSHAQNSSLETSENNLVPSKLKHPCQFGFLRWPPPCPAADDHERLRF
jgi:hypothetical protein